MLKRKRKKLCFNSTGGQHKTSECHSNRTCFTCHVNITHRFNKDMQ